MVVVSEVKRSTYQDSVRLMRISESLSSLAGVNQAIVAMATDANKRVMAEVGLLTNQADQAGANDLALVIEANSEDAAQNALAQAEMFLAETKKSNGAASVASAPRTLDQAQESLDRANLTLVSVSGQYAMIEAAKALQKGMHVFLFSDNVTLEEELNLKRWAVSKQLLMMGPGCGTAIINGVALAFANVVRRGPVGIVGASGTGLQEVTSLIDRGGSGVSQAIGVGGRDLSEDIGGLMMLQGISMLADDPETEVIVLISKPPAPSVTEEVLEAARASKKPVIVNFLGSQLTGNHGGLTFTARLSETAAEALQLVLGETPPFFIPNQAELDRFAAVERQKMSSEQRYIRGLYSGGSLCDETMVILESELHGIYSNIPFSPEYALEDAWQSYKHSCIDMGEEEFTRGRPHPMIDPRLRQERMLSEAGDPSVAVILLDVVIGYGSHADPAGALAGTIGEAKAIAALEGRYLSVVAHVCGTDQDPQGLEVQEEILREVGTLVLPTNAQAAQLAAMIVQG